MQKVIATQKTIHLPFDGMAKNTAEVAKMIGEALMKRSEENVDIFFPAQWAMNAVNILHPEGGVLALLNKDSEIKAAYKFAGFARNGAMGVTATRSC